VFEKIISKTPGNSQPPRPASTPVSSQAPASSSFVAAAPSKLASPVSAASSGGQRNILSNDVHIKGSIRFTNDLLVDGRIEGEINSDGALTVAENAYIKAEIKTQSVVIYGKVHGNIICTDRVEIKQSAEMVGDVKAVSLSIEPGAIFVGKSEVGTSSAAPKQNSPAPKQNSPAPKQNSPAPQGNAKKPQQDNQSDKAVAPAS
jgi:cytoskeletal protein CcmA (bactofilin family)